MNFSTDKLYKPLEFRYRYENWIGNNKFCFKGKVYIGYIKNFNLVLDINAGLSQHYIS